MLVVLIFGTLPPSLTFTKLIDSQQLRLRKALEELSMWLVEREPPVRQSELGRRSLSTKSWGTREQQLDRTTAQLQERYKCIPKDWRYIAGHQNVTNAIIIFQSTTSSAVSVGS